VQYNTTNNLVTKEIAPFELKLSRDRVTEEDAPVAFLSPKHPVLNQPNLITNQDFEGWIQERGLYFPNEWSNEFIPILAMNDKGEITNKRKFTSCQTRKRQLHLHRIILFQRITRRR
jgi:hypothetical protein